MEIVHETSYDTHAQIGKLGATETFGISDSAEFITTISKTLYANGTLAMVRETICNAWDAHIAAGKQDTPLEIHLHDGIFAVKDFGHGIHKSSIHSTYCVYGNSTKNKDNSQTGGFGLGTKAPFAYSDFFTVISCHDGTKQINKILRVSDEHQGRPSRTVIVEVPTEETGITVQVPYKREDFSDIRDMIEGVCQFGNIKAKFYTTEENFRMIEHFDASTAGRVTVIQKDGQCYVDTSAGVVIRYGTVIYPIPDKIKNIPAMRAFSIARRNTNQLVIIEAVPGSLIVQPSREHLSETPKNIETLQNLLSDVYKDIGYEKLRPELQEQIYKEVFYDHAGMVNKYPFRTLSLVLSPNNEILDIKNLNEKIHLLLLRSTVPNNYSWLTAENPNLDKMIKDFSFRFWNENKSDVANILLNRNLSTFRKIARIRKYLRKLTLAMVKANIDPKMFLVDAHRLSNAGYSISSGWKQPLSSLDQWDIDAPPAQSLGIKRVIIGRTNTSFSSPTLGADNWFYRAKKKDVEKVKQFFLDHGFKVHVQESSYIAKTPQPREIKVSQPDMYKWAKLISFYPYDSYTENKSSIAPFRKDQTHKPDWYLDIGSMDSSLFSLALFENAFKGIGQTTMVCSTDMDVRNAKKWGAKSLNDLLYTEAMWTLINSRNVVVAGQLAEEGIEIGTIVDLFRIPLVQIKLDVTPMSKREMVILELLKNNHRLLCRDSDRNIDNKTHNINNAVESANKGNDIGRTIYSYSQVRLYSNHDRRVSVFSKEKICDLTFEMAQSIVLRRKK